MQRRASAAYRNLTDIFLMCRDLRGETEEGIHVEEFRADAGGVGGAVTDSLVQLIAARLEAVARPVCVCVRGQVQTGGRLSLAGQGRWIELFSSLDKFSMCAADDGEDFFFLFLAAWW